MKEKSNHIIITESDRPIWQIPVAALFFTAATFVLGFSFYRANWTMKGFEFFIHSFEIFAFLLSFGVGFSSQKRVHIDLKNSRFKPSFEIGPIKIGKWYKIENPEYVSFFNQLKKNGEHAYEVNLWYDTNKHLELYERPSYKDAFMIAFELSEELDIDLLDSTEANNYRWIDKEATKKSKEIIYTE